MHAGHVQPVRHQQGLHLLPGAGDRPHQTARAAARRPPQAADVRPHPALQAPRADVT